jgi:benzodiazapine receptor
MSRTRAIIGLVVFIAICFIAAGMGALFNQSSIAEWYPALRKPSWTPPNAVFGPVWSVLYLMMAVAAWLVWRRAGLSGAAAALLLFGLQLASNVAWSGLFFGLRMPGAAFADILVLWGLIVATVVTFWRVSPAAGILMAPYLGWVSFAAALNLAVWRMNA